MNDLSNQQYLDLLAERDALDKRIEEIGAIARRGVIENIKAQMAQLRIVLEDLMPARGARKSAGAGSGSIAAKYVDPVTDATWSGRGRAPLWMAGKDRSIYEIPANPAIPAVQEGRA